jgi:hypothetical protein
MYLRRHWTETNDHFEKANTRIILAHGLRFGGGCPSLNFMHTGDATLGLEARLHGRKARSLVWRISKAKAKAAGAAAASAASAVVGPPAPAALQAAMTL